MGTVVDWWNTENKYFNCGFHKQIRQCGERSTLNWSFSNPEFTPKKKKNPHQITPFTLNTCMCIGVGGRAGWECWGTLNTAMCGAKDWPCWNTLLLFGVVTNVIWYQNERLGKSCYGKLAWKQFCRNKEVQLADTEAKLFHCSTDHNEWTVRQTLVKLFFCCYLVTFCC